jgi:hypothetical protein
MAKNTNNPTAPKRPKSPGKTTPGVPGNADWIHRRNQRKNSGGKRPQKGQ